MAYAFAPGAVIGRVFSHAEIIAAVWTAADHAGVSEEAVEGLIKRPPACVKPPSITVKFCADKC